MHTDHAPTNNGIRPHLIPILILTVIFLVNFLNRIVLAPLLPAIEKDLGLSHTAAGSFFLLMSLGYFVSLLGSGFVAARLTLRRTVLLSSFILGVATLGGPGSACGATGFGVIGRALLPMRHYHCYRSH